MPAIQPAVAASTDLHFQQLGLQRGHIAEWEDGLRTDTTSGTYEWWYFDALLDDGAKLVIVFYTKDFNTSVRPLSPLITLDLYLPDGRRVSRRAHFTPEEFQASADRCDVRIGDNRFSGDLHTYSIHIAIEDVTIDVQLQSLTEPWRPHAGSLLFGEDEAKYFSWLPAIPHGAVVATYKYGSVVQKTTGTGYHDHNWGNEALIGLVNHWYWGRGYLDRYSLISAYITTEAKYSYASFPIFMLARDGKVIADDDTKVIFTKSDIHIDEITGKPVADVMRFDYRDGETRYLLTYSRRATIIRIKYLDTFSGLLRVAMQMTGFNGAYLRFSGTLTLDHFQGEQLVEHHEADTLWELMYLGDSKHEAQ